jgi:hypothetical protein
MCCAVLLLSVAPLPAETMTTAVVDYGPMAFNLEGKYWFPTSQVIQIPQFDSSLGTLDSATLYFSADWGFGAIGVKNISGSTQTAKFTLTLPTEYAPAFGGSYESSTMVIQSVTVPPNGVKTVYLSPPTPAPANSGLLTNAASLSAMTGTSTFDLTVTPGIGLVVEGYQGFEYGSGFIPDAMGTAYAEYNYTKGPVVPAPSTLVGLLGMGAIGLVFGGWRRWRQAGR